MERFASMDSFQFGSAPVATNQSAGYARAGNGGVVLALGIVSWVLCFTVLGALICATVAVVLGIKELAHIREGRSPQSDRLMVLFGLWLGILNLVAVLASLIVIIAIAILNP